MLKIRAATADDTADLQRIARAAYALYVPLIGREPPPMLQDFPADIAARRVWVIGAPPEGFIVAGPRGNHWLLENVAIDPAAQGKGLGRALIAHVEAMARSTGSTSVELYTHAKMTANRALYPSLGYVEVDQRTEDGLDRVFFRKTLQPDQDPAAT